MDDTIYRQAAIEVLVTMQGLCTSKEALIQNSKIWQQIKDLPPAQSEIIHCKDCKYWRQQTNFAGELLSFGFCESDDMWQSLYGETTEVEHIDTDYNHYCGYAKRRTNEE